MVTITKIGLMQMSAISDIQKSRNRLKKCLYTGMSIFKRVFHPSSFSELPRLPTYVNKDAGNGWHEHSSAPLPRFPTDMNSCPTRQNRKSTRSSYITKHDILPFLFTKKHRGHRDFSIAHYLLICKVWNVRLIALIS